jgi:hypothetical protein
MCIFMIIGMSVSTYEDLYLPLGFLLKLIQKQLQNNSVVQNTNNVPPAINALATSLIIRLYETVHIVSFPKIANVR